MSPIGSGTQPPQAPFSGQTADAEQKEWILRGIAGLVTVLLVWLMARDGLILLAPFVAGGLVTAMRLEMVSQAVDSIENWLKKGSTKAASKQGKFARFVQRPFFASSLAIWRWTTPIPDAHLKAGVRIAALILIAGVAVTLVVVAVYVIIAIVVLVLTVILMGWFLSLHAEPSVGGASPRAVTRVAKDWFGKPKQEHFDSAGNKIGESRPEKDWLGKPKLVHTDAQGNKVGESRPDKDWLGQPKTVHTDNEGHVTGESRPDKDWLGNPKTVHTDPEGNVTGESRVTKDWLGNVKIEHRDK